MTREALITSDAEEGPLFLDEDFRDWVVEHHAGHGRESRLHAGRDAAGLSLGDDLFFNAMVCLRGLDVPGVNIWALSTAFDRDGALPLTCGNP